MYPECDALALLRIKYMRTPHYRHSSIFHALFYRIFDMVMKSGSEATVKNLLGKPKFVTKMLELYDTDKSHSKLAHWLYIIALDYVFCS